MKHLFLSTVLTLICFCGFATTVTVNASSTGTTTSSAKTAGTITVNNTTNRGYAVFNLATASIPAAATITSVKLIFTHTVSGSGSSTRTIYGYSGDISLLDAASLYTGAITANTMYTASWGNSSTTKTMASTAGADTFIQHNHTGLVSTTWVESGSSRVYSITGGASPYLQITYTCTTPSSVSISTSSNPVCSGSSETLTGHATGGSTYSWSGPNGFSSTALVPSAFTTSTASAGVYTFVATSVCNISTSATTTLTVLTAPAAITGATTVCVGSSTTLSNTASGGTWSRSNTRATVGAGTGLVTGVTTGAITISYSTGCGSAATQAMTVVTTPAAITGSSIVCVGSSTTLSDATSGGTWSSSNTSVATVNSGTGAVWGVTSGAATISYANSCGTVTKAVTVTVPPAAISGSTSVCEGNSVTLTESVLGGTWSKNNSRVSFDTSTSGTNIVTGVNNGSTTITYSTGCGSDVTLGMTINNSPNTITGTMHVCSGSTHTLSSTTGSGVWSSANTSIATVNSSTGLVTGLSEGVVTISYTKTGCSRMTSDTVRIAPAAIAGSANICAGSTTVLTNASLYGTWSASNAAIASVNATGTVTGVAVGSANISYSTGCGTAASKTETVISTPAAITGTTTVCTGATTTLADATMGGSWSSSNSAIATISSGGVVTGMAQGSANITYAISSCLATTSVLVKTAPAAITGTTALCGAGLTSALANTSNNGTWSTSDAAIASIDAAGLVTSVAVGAATITYNTGCGSNATATFSVDQVPAALSGATAMCSGYTEAITETVNGGTWSSSNTAVASVNTSGVVYGVAAGTADISYSLTNACGANVVSQGMAVSQTGLWIGASNDWNDAANWPCGIIPDATINVTIPSGTSFLPDFTGATFSMNNLTINAAVTLPIAGDAIVAVYGNLTNNGIVNGDGVIKMNGSSAQTIYGKGTYSNLEINNAAGVTLNSGDTIRMIADLTLTAGAFTTNSGVRLVSNAAGTARIAPVTGGSTAGSVQVEQYFEGGRRAYRFFAHPFNTSIPLSMIGANLDITGAGGASNGFTTTASNAPSSFRYNPLVGNSSLSSDPGWKAFTNANAATDTNEFKQHQGIRLFVRGAKGEGLYYTPYTPSATTISMQGQVNTGNQVITLHKGLNSDYNQVGNPYPSPTDIGTVINNAKIAGQVAGSAFFVWNPFLGSAGAFETKVIGGAYILDQNSSFQVRAVNDGSTLTFDESNKAANGDETLLRSTNEYITLKVVDANNHPWDMMYLSFNDNATNNEDVQFDATKALNPDLNFYSYAGNTKFAVDARPYSQNTIIPIGFTTNYAQQYTIRAENVVLPAGATLYLHDKMLNQYVMLQAGAAYSFDITNDKATQGENRFELTANNGSAVATAIKGLTVSMNPNPATDKVTIEYTNDAKAATTVSVMNVTGASVITKTIGNDASGKVTISLNELPAGIYMVEVASGNNKNIQKLVKE